MPKNAITLCMIWNVRRLHKYGTMSSAEFRKILVHFELKWKQNECFF